MLYVRAGADINTTNADGKTIFLLACENKEKSFVDELILREDIAQFIDMQDNVGWTALIDAAYGNHTAIVDMLLKAGAAPDIQNNQGWTALLGAAYNGHTEVVKILVAAGAKLDIQNNTGWTALLGAANKGHTAIVEMLLEAGAKPDIANNDGWTALLGAAYNGHTEAASMLVCRLSNEQINYKKNGLASTDAKLNGGNHSALSIALIMDKPEIIAALLDHPGIDLGAGTTKLFAQHKRTFVAALEIWTEKAYPAFKKEFYQREDSGQYVVEKTQSILQQKQHLTRQLIDLKHSGYISDTVKNTFLNNLNKGFEKIHTEVEHTRDFLDKWQASITMREVSKNTSAAAESNGAKKSTLTPDNVAAFELTAFLDPDTKGTVAKIIRGDKGTGKCIVM